MIRILGMRVPAKVGAQAAEREQAQQIDIDLELQLDSERAARSDDLADAVDYAQVHAACVHVVGRQPFVLLEALAAACLDEVLSDARITGATIRVRKPHVLGGATPEVELTRANTGKAGVPSAENQTSNARKH